MVERVIGCCSCDKRGSAAVGVSTSMGARLLLVLTPLPAIGRGCGVFAEARMQLSASANPACKRGGSRVAQEKLVACSDSVMLVV